MNHPRMSVKEMLAKVDEYYDAIQDGGRDPNVKFPTLERCMEHLGYTRQSIYDMAMEKGKSRRKT